MSQQGEDKHYKVAIKSASYCVSPYLIPTNTYYNGNIGVPTLEILISRDGSNLQNREASQLQLLAGLTLPILKYVNYGFVLLRILTFISNFLLSFTLYFPINTKLSEKNDFFRVLRVHRSRVLSHRYSVRLINYWIKMVFFTLELLIIIYHVSGQHLFTVK